MKRNRLLWRIYPTYLLITLIALLSIGWYTSLTLQDFYHNEVRSDLQSRTRLIDFYLSQYLDTSVYKTNLDTVCRTIQNVSSTAVTLIGHDGAVLCDSGSAASMMSEQSRFPEVQEALSGRTGYAIRHSASNHDAMKMMYLALPHLKDGKVIAVVRSAIPVTSIDSALGTIISRLLVGGLIIGFIAAIVSLIISKRLIRPLEEMKKGAMRFAAGELNYRLRLYNAEEIADLAEAMNQMAVQLNDRLNRIARQNSEQEALLSSMVEGVIAVNNQEQIISINQAAASLFHIDNPESAMGRYLHEVIRKKSIHQFITQVLTSREVTESEIVIYEKDEKHLLARGTVLRSPDGEEIGTLVVLNDMTSLRRLETVRRDFVANVSHELKTPITSIKGFVETLSSGAIEDTENAKRFLAIISRQADRLEAIIEDLLTLAKIEQNADRAEILLKQGLLKEVLEAAINDCELKWMGKNIRIQLSCPCELVVRMNNHLLEQAVSNLIDNAIKYSEPGSAVEVQAVQTPYGVKIHVTDYGRGISREHLSRIFERFYRVDKARSRKLGGTGLGLAIVKHIARVHHGNVLVDSIPGKGSVFTIILPCIDQPQSTDLKLEIKNEKLME
ncbi:MAG TPA: ATP-binding protein [Thermodesulfovibrionia bacterium]|nr:ATP-binding protein [Thermodesulfovibrionia bacterium]